MNSIIPHGTSLVAQSVKNLPPMQETQVQFLCQEDPLEKEMATHSSVLAWRIPMDRGTWQATVHGVSRVRHDLATKPPPWIEEHSSLVHAVAKSQMWLSMHTNAPPPPKHTHTHTHVKSQLWQYTALISDIIIDVVSREPGWRIGKNSQYKISKFLSVVTIAK